MKKNKWINIIVTAAVLFSTSGCMDSFSDIKSNNKILPKDVWNDPAAITGILANMYNSMIIEDFSYFYGDYSWRSMDLSAMSDECTAGFQKEPAFDQYNAVFEYPDEFLGNYIYIQGDQGGEGNVRSVYPESYRLIRNCNDFLEKIIDAPMNEDEKKTTIGEVKFLRAWVYFTLVKRYGGVPLIDKPQQYTGKESLAELEVPRSTEEEIFRFIIKDCKEAAEALPEVRTTEKARVTRYAALALCSRAALYAGSIAKYGKVGLGKLTGIESSKADEFYQIAYDAADFIIKKGPYKLFNQIPDKEQNFNKLFVTKDNGEYIFEKLFDVATGLGNSYDKKHLPYSYCRWGSITPTFEMVEAFEYQDGSEGKIDIGQSFETTYEMFQGKDPRFLASIYVPGSSLLGSTMQFQRGLILKDGSKYYAQSAPGPSYLLETYIDPETQRKDTIFGKDGGTYTGDASKTGFNIRKFVNENLKTEAQWDFGKTETSFPIFRLAEVYLNLAEATVEMGKYQTEAFEAIKKIRDRAGVVTPFAVVDVEKVRHERQVELAFEGHRFWDMKRWRIAHLPVDQGGLNGFRGAGLHPFFDLRIRKYVFEVANDLPKRQRVFTEKNYYTKFSGNDMNSNPSLIQNPEFLN